MVRPCLIPPIIQHLCERARRLPYCGRCSFDGWRRSYIPGVFDGYFHFFPISFDYRTSSRSDRLSERNNPTEQRPLIFDPFHTVSRVTLYCTCSASGRPATYLSYTSQPSYHNHPITITTTTTTTTTHHDTATGAGSVGDHARPVRTYRGNVSQITQRL